MTRAKPKLAVFKFASCDGCQLSLLNCENELLALAGRVQIANFAEASREVLKGPYDLTLVEGAVTTAHDAGRIQDIRRRSRHLVAIGACATTGGLLGFRAGAVARHVKVDGELYGCPVDKQQLLEVISAFLAGRKPVTPGHSTCLECKLAGRVCVAVAHGIDCRGPLTHAGCGALCPSFARGCTGCFGVKTG